jgi:hypothetical protein
VAVYGRRIAKGLTVVRDCIYSHPRLIGFLSCRDGVRKVGDPGPKKAAQPTDSFCAAMERLLAERMRRPLRGLGGVRGTRDQSEDGRKGRPSWKRGAPI